MKEKIISTLPVIVLAGLITGSAISAENRKMPKEDVIDVPAIGEGLLGVLAQRFNTRIEWDAQAGRITNRPELNAFVKEPTREGWRYGENL
jgi:hypothetical protein